MTSLHAETCDQRDSATPARLIRSLHVVPSLALGGAARGALEIVRGLQQRPGHQAALCVLGQQVDHPLLGELTVPPIFLDMPVHESGHLIRRWKQLREQIRKHRPDVLHAHLWPASRICAWASLGLPAQLIVHIRDTPPDFARTSLRGGIKRSLLRSALTLSNARYLCVSQAAKNYSVQHLGLDPQQIVVVLNGIDVSDFEALHQSEAPRQTGVLTLGTAGRLEKPKGHAFLVDAVQLVRQRGYDVRLRIAGSGGLEPALKSKVKAARLTDAVIFLGPIDRMPEFYAGIDVFVLPSIDSEGLPRVLMEAMCSGRTVIGTNAAGVNEVVTSGETGLIVPPGDEVALADVIEELARKPDRCAVIGQSARREALRRFPCSRVVDEVASHYEQLLPSMPRST